MPIRLKSARRCWNGCALPGNDDPQCTAAATLIFPAACFVMDVAGMGLPTVAIRPMGLQLT